MKTTTFLILTGLVWVWTLLKSGTLRSPTPVGYRLSLVMISLLLLWSGSYQVLLLIWGIFNPSSFFARFYAPAGVFPATAGFGVAIVAGVAGCLEYYIGFLLAGQKRAALVWGAKASPFLFLAACLDLFIRVSRRSWGATGAYYWSGIGLLVVGAIYLWLYAFCANPRNQELVRNNTEPGDAPNVGPAASSASLGPRKGPSSVN